MLDDLQARFGIGAITMVADRGLISADNVCPPIRGSGWSRNRHSPSSGGTFT